MIAASTAEAQTTAAARRIVLRSYNTFGISSAKLEQAEATVRELLRDTGVDASWRDCRTTDGPSSHSPDLCNDVVSASEVIIRIVRAPRAIPDMEALGYSHVDPYRRQGTLGTVFADRIRALAAALRIDEGTLLGRAMTHEVGHLLLGTLDHSPDGLMRRQWSNHGRAADWIFSVAQAEQIRAAIATRTENGLTASIALAHATR